MKNESLGEQIEQSIHDRDATKPFIDEITRLEKEVKRLRRALENEWKIAHNDYCGCSLDGRMKCDHPKPKALATEAPQ